MGLFGTPMEQRAVTYQDVWGSDSVPEGSRQYSPSKALQLSTVIACVQLRYNLLSQLPVEATRRAASGVEVPLAVQPSLIRQPTPKVTRSVWLKQYSISRDLWGFACGAKTAFDAAGYPTTIDWLPPHEVSIVENRGQPAQFWVNGQPVDQGMLLYVPGMVLPGTIRGRSPLELTGLVELARLAQNFGRDWFRNGAVPSSILYSDMELDEQQADRLRDRMMQNWRRRRPAVLGSGLKYEQVSVTANESQFIETMRDTRAQICNSFLVPPEELSIPTGGSALTYANREQRAQQMLVNMLNADIVSLEEALASQLPRGTEVRIDSDALLRSDLATRVSTGAQAVTARLLLPNEWRRREGLEPYEGGDSFALPPVDPPAQRGAPDA